MRLFLLLLTLFLQACQYIRPQLQVLNKNAVCLYIPIHNLANKHIHNQLESLLNLSYESDLRKCKYITIINPMIENMMLADSTGAQMHYNVKMTTMFSVIKINTAHVDNLQEIIENPDTIEFELYTGGKFGGIGRKVIRDAQINYNTQLGYHQAYFKMLVRLNEHHTELYSGNEININTYMANPNMMTSEYQSKTDTIEFLAKKTAENIFNHITIAIAQNDNDK